MDNVLHPYGTNAGREHEHKQTWRRLNVTESEVIPGNMNVELIPKERAISPASMWFCKEKSLIKGPYRCYYKSLSFVSIGHTSYINLIHFPQNSFIYEISCLFTFLSIFSKHYKKYMEMCDKTI